MSSYLLKRFIFTLFLSTFLRAFGDAHHAVRVVVAHGRNAQSRGRAQRRGVHVVVVQAIGSQVIGSQCVQVGHLNGPAIAAELSKAGVVLANEQHAGESAPSMHVSRQARLDLSTVQPMTPGKVVPGFYSIRDMYISHLLVSALIKCIRESKCFHDTTFC